MSFTSRRFSYQPRDNKASVSSTISRSESYQHSTKYQPKPCFGETHHTHSNGASPWPIEEQSHEYDAMIDDICTRDCDPSLPKETPNLSADHLFSTSSAFAETPSLVGQSFDSDTSGSLLPTTQTSTSYDFSVYRSSLLPHEQNVGLGIQGLFKEDGSCFNGSGVLSYRDCVSTSSDSLEPDEGYRGFEEQAAGSVGWWGWSTGQGAVFDSTAYASASSTEKQGSYNGPASSISSGGQFTRRHRRSESYFGNNTINSRVEAEVTLVDMKIPARGVQTRLSATKSRNTTRLGRSTVITPTLPTEDDVFYSNGGQFGAGSA